MILNDLALRTVVKRSVVAMTAVFFVSCSTTKPPTQELAQTEAAISQADQVGAQDYAPLVIREARKKLQEAKKLVSEEKYKKAVRVAERAEIDAQLAEAKALSEKSQNAVQQLRESIRLLKEEIERNQFEE